MRESHVDQRCAFVISKNAENVFPFLCTNDNESKRELMIESKLNFASAGEIRLGGYGREMIKYVIENQLLDADTWAILVDQFRRREDSSNGGWRGEYWGKMMRGASLTYRATKNEKLYSVLVDTVKDMLTTQDKLGRFSTYSTETEFTNWDMWARKYVILGMAYFTDVCKSKALKNKIISALRRHADYIIDKVGEGRLGILDTSERIGAMNSASILEAFVRMYSLTEDKKYLDYAAYIISTGMCKGADLVDLCLNRKMYPYQFPVTKAYEMMSCFEGLLEYYKHTGNPDHLLAVESFVDMIVKTDYTLIGCSGCNHEFLDNSTSTQTEPAKADVMQETCVTVTFIKLCAKLLSVTGNAKYAEYIERSGLNAMYGAVNNEKQMMKRAFVRTWLPGGEVYVIERRDGYPFDSYSPLYQDRRAIRCGGVQLIGDDERHYGCCVCIGSAGTAIMGLFALMKNDGGVYVNLYNDCRFTTEIDEEQIRVNVKADPYSSSGAKIKIDGKGKSFTLALRIPTWAESFTARVNGEEIVGEEQNGYLLINRVWDKDKVDVSFKASVKMHVINKKIAFTKGPIALAGDRRLYDISSPVSMSVRDGKRVRAKRVANDTFTSNLALEIKTRDGSITLCDYAQSGKDYDDEKSKITVWMDKK